ncbi:MULTISPECIES: hypothetical protein [Paraburkholderia]|uniref:Uncharacterized protein n=1 Tax=Paraburkholderia tropica TaxID=92647 RepID=A0ABX5MK07_9BURK|nr:MULTISPECIES: hypothetical protein [Paraburkholderia]MBB2999982.1 hypothetical protein [Paraburkholderia tropica]MBB6319613.1 hypothetical protein [Paraburkholderia tropica]MDE1142956.1 hypothetical protein [Paraburkholderia tropica]PXX13603.1 hypothetical protein C7400_115173 [Paraburkholderia tropica]PZW78534.1 hypothetical protein C7399_114173 [Paraburkholderia tropica]
MAPVSFFHHSVCAIVLVTLGALTSAGAQAGQPLILDTQHGISDGQKGIVLQNAPLGQSQMVPMQQLPSPDANNQQPIIVAPYVEVPGGGGGRPPRPRPAQQQYAPAQ